jgi:hypothetical protein
LPDQNVGMLSFKKMWVCQKNLELDWNLKSSSLSKIANALIKNIGIPII